MRLKQNAGGDIISSNITNTELNYLDNITRTAILLNSSSTGLLNNTLIDRNDIVNFRQGVAVNQLNALMSYLTIKDNNFNTSNLLAIDLSQPNKIFDIFYFSSREKDQSRSLNLKYQEDLTWTMQKTQKQERVSLG